MQATQNTPISEPITFDNYQTLIQLFQVRSEFTPDRPALHEKREGSYQPILWKELSLAVKETALGLIDLGITPRDRVAILSENRPEWTVADLATYAATAAVVPIYSTNGPTQVQYILSNSGSKAVFCSDAEQVSKILAIEEELEQPLWIICMENDLKMDEHGENYITMADLRSRGRGLESKDKGIYQSRIDQVGPEDLASIIYTSGTTGPPKGVMLTHANFISNVKAAGEVLPMQMDDIALSFLPLAHVFERTCGLYIMLLGCGAQIAYAESIETVPQNMNEVRPTIMASVPRLYEKIYDRIHEAIRSQSAFKQWLFAKAIAVGATAGRYSQEGKPLPWLLSFRLALANRLVLSKIQARTGGRLRYFVSGGAPLAQEIAEFFHAAGMIILEGYGLTETSPALTMNRPDAYRFGTVGKPVPGVDIRIAEDGEILAKGPNIMKGYFGMEEATREAIDPDGWFHTGDVGEFDSDGFLRITDRKKDLIVTSGGKNVAPQLLENRLKTLPFISQIVCVGDKRKFISALIVPDFDVLEKTVTEMGIDAQSRMELLKNSEVLDLFQKTLDTAQEDLAGYEKVKKFSLLESEFTQEAGELTPTHKIRRKSVQDNYRSLIDTMYES
ncbi:MAG: long-chain fatty acid--CoA ligase [Planctomycetota bacterium]|nr:long-chain fatty acid--CoA ligase [Planctomycetota bacterium]